MAVDADNSVLLPRGHAMSKKTVNPHRGSDFDSFLKEEGLFEEVQATAIKQVLARAIEQHMLARGVTKTEMAHRIGTSRSQFDRLLDPMNTAATLSTLARAAAAIGQRLIVRLELGESVRVKGVATKTAKQAQKLVPGRKRTDHVAA